LESSRIVTYEMEMKKRDELLGRVGKHLLSHGEILFAYAHGSFLEAKHFRDLDVGVFLAKEDFQRVRYTYEIGLEEELESLLGLNIPLDVRLLNSASISFQYRAIGGRLLLDRAPDLRMDFCTRVMSRYLDIRPILLYHTKEAFSYETRP